MLKAARLGDQISHTSQRSGLLMGMLAGAAIVALLAATVFTGGAALVVVGAVLTGAAVGGGIGRWWGSTQTVPKGNINKAATTVFVNSRATPAARSCIDTALCQDHALQLIATGSTTVYIETFPAARISDTGACSFKISQGSDNVFIGGATAQCAGVEITPEVEPWLENLHLAVGLVGSFCLGFGALGWAGSALMTGLGFGGSLLGSEIGGRYFGKWGAIAGGVLGGILGGGFGVGISRGLQNASRNTAANFYRQAGWQQSRIDQHITGINFTKPVRVTTIPKGTEVVQYQVPGKPVGNYFAPPGTTASELGINPAGRQPTTFTAGRDVQVLRSTASPVIDTWSTPGQPFQTQGGGTQYFVPDPSDFIPKP